MRIKTKSARVKAAIRVRTRVHEAFTDPKCKVKADTNTDLTDIRITSDVEVGTLDGYLRFWTAGREIRIGPLTPDQAEKLSEDLGYDAVA
jgi:hypothetical protein